MLLCVSPKIVTFPGSNCDYDTYHAVVDALGEEATYLWHKDHDLRGSDVVILPGGFSYGDYLRAGAIARFSPIMREVVSHAERGAPVLAICNGFQIACEAGMLPGALLRNASLRFVCEAVRLRVENADTQFTNRYDRGQLITVPIATPSTSAISRYLNPSTAHNSRTARYESGSSSMAFFNRASTCSQSRLARSNEVPSRVRLLTSIR